MERWVTVPGNIYEFLLGSPWPIVWAYGLLGLIAVLGAFVATGARRAETAETASPASLHWTPAAPRWLLALPVAWLAWQCLAATQTLDPRLTGPTLKYFFACAVCFYLGAFALSQVRRLGLFWTALLCGFLLMLATGWEQRFGGLEATRKYFFLYLYPQMKELPPEYLKKISSSRIFATLFYPNSLAGALLLLLPVMLAFIGSARQYFTASARWFLLTAICLAALACLYWSGSKGGWLLMLCLGLLTLLRLPLANSIKVGLVAVVLLAGVAGFFVKYAQFFQKGATSVSARFDYWQAALQTAKANPLFGTGPGTFTIPYQRIKRPESEMTRLVHNDYLEQASDSGFPSFLFYTVFIAGALTWTASRKVCVASSDWQSFAIWLGLFGWALQSFFEFSLYIPALAWTAFALLGLLLGPARNLMDDPHPPG